MATVIEQPDACLGCKQLEAILKTTRLVIHKTSAELDKAQAGAARMEVQRDDARFALRKLKAQIQGDCL